ncbi:hypothetical protein F8S13_25390 [Chloroflexia bacterium SDU3-3]|nr:hypothetical protein F8S13_25390 [Chloroflexia bacterium SDU3-3]
MRCRTCQQRIRRELETCPYCGGRTKQASTGKTRHLSPQQLAQPPAPPTHPQITLPTLALMTLGVFTYSTLWLALWPLPITVRSRVDPDLLIMYIGFACAFFLPFAAWHGWWRCSLLLACGAAVAMVMRMNMG